MDLRTRSRNVLRNSILVLASLTISVFAWGQHGQESGDRLSMGVIQTAPVARATQARPVMDRVRPAHENSHGQRAPASVGRGTRTPGRPGESLRKRRQSRRKHARQSRRKRAGNRGGNTPDNRGGNDLPAIEAEIPVATVADTPRLIAEA